MKPILLRGSMLYLNPNKLFSLLTAVKYTHKKDASYDYLALPRPCHNFLFMLDGNGEILTEKETIPLKRGDILFIPKGTTYKSVWKPNPVVHFHSIHFNFSPPVNPFENINVPIQKITSLDFNTAYSLVETVHKNQYERNQNSFFALSSFLSLCGNLFKELRFEERKRLLGSIQPALDYLQKNYTQQCTVENLAELCFLSPSRFYYLFQKETGETPIHYKNRLTVEACAQKLIENQSVSVEEIASAHGFESAVYFRRLFKKLTGKTPTEYRKQELSL